MNDEQKFTLVRSVGEECIAEEELKNLISKKPNFVLYDGFEPSGRMHIAQGIFKAMNVNKCTQVISYVSFSLIYLTSLEEPSSSGSQIGLLL